MRWLVINARRITPKKPGIWIMECKITLQAYRAKGDWGRMTTAIVETIPTWTAPEINCHQM